MVVSDQLATIVERISQDKHTEADVSVLQQLLAAGESPELLQLGKYNINIGQGQDIQIGDRTYVDWNEDAMTALLAVVQEQQPKVVGIPDNLPRSGVVDFVGRVHELQHLHQQLQDCAPGKAAAVTGMGGVGKTELVLQYALENKEQYAGGLIWLQGRGVDVGSQIVQYGRSRLHLSPSEELDVLAQVGFCWSHWPQGDVLVLIDDVIDYKKIRPYLPPAEARFQVLMTTRQRLGKSVQQLSLDVLQTAASSAVLASLVGATRIEAEPDETQALCDWLGHLPLGLELVGRYLDRKPDLSIEDMLGRLTKKGLEARSLRKADADMTQPLGITSAFDLTWDSLDESAQQLACMLSLFAAAPLTWDLAEKIAADEDAEDLEEIRDDYLIGLNLLQRKAENTYQLHQLVREFLQEKAADVEEIDVYKKQFCKTMAEVARQIPESPTRDFIGEIAIAIPHIAESATVLASDLEDETITEPFTGLIRFYESQGLYDRAQEWCESGALLTGNRCSQSSWQYALSMGSSGRIYRFRGQYAEAETAYNQARAIRTALFGESSAQVAEVLNDLATVYYDRSDYAEAEVLFAQALKSWERAAEPMPAEISDCLNNLGMLYIELGQPENAEERLVRSLTISQEHYGETHPRVATSLNNLAQCYETQGEYEKATALYEQSLALRQDLLGEDHPKVAGTLNNLGMLQVEQKAYEAAEDLLVRSLDIHKRIYGEKHPNVAMSLNNLAYLYDLQENYQQAEPLYIEALNMRKEVLGEDHAYVGISLNNLATLYRLQARYADAKPLYQQSLVILKKQVGEDHPIVLQVQGNLDKLTQADPDNSDEPASDIKTSETPKEAEPAPEIAEDNKAEKKKKKGKKKKGEKKKGSKKKKK